MNLRDASVGRGLPCDHLFSQAIWAPFTISVPVKHFRGENVYLRIHYGLLSEDTLQPLSL